MSNYTYEQVACPHIYFPNNPSRLVQRVVMKTIDGQTAGWVDYLIEDGWNKAILFVVEKEHRNQETVLGFLNKFYQLVSQPTQTFWWMATPSMEPYFEQIAAARPDLTFAAGGAINRVIHATE